AFKPVLVEHHASQQLAIGFGEPVIAVRSHRVVDVEYLATLIKSDGVIGACKDDPLPLETGRFKQVGKAKNIGLDDLGKGFLDADAAEMHDCFRATHKLLDGRLIGKIGLHELCVIRQVIGKRHYVGEPQVITARGKTRCKKTTDRKSVV